METLDIIPRARQTYKIYYPCENSSECHPILLNFHEGTYKIELWGAGLSNGGGYTSGVKHFYAKTKIFLFIGGIAQEGEYQGIGGYNGGGTSKIIGVYNGAYRKIGGDGATDLRLNETDLESRIMVAAGAGGGSSNYKGGHGGGLIGGDGMYWDGTSKQNSIVGKGATQNNGGEGKYYGSFGVGAASEPTLGTDRAGSGGGGYYGGGSGYHYERSAAGGGGSSYISGFPECSVHNSSFVFYKTKMIPGNETMPYIKGGQRNGPFGNGFARITCIGIYNTCRCQRRNSLYSLIYIIVFSSY